MVKRLPMIWETQVQSLGQEDPLEKAMATHSSTLAWKIPWVESVVGYSPWGRKESDTTERLHFTFFYQPEIVSGFMKRDLLKNKYIYRAPDRPQIIFIV